MKGEARGLLFQIPMKNCGDHSPLKKNYSASNVEYFDITITPREGEGKEHMKEAEKASFSLFLLKTYGDQSFKR